MIKISHSQALAISRKFFGHLLFAYPKAHREEYGAAMAQLFRDQSRDAWNEARNFGLAKLWLRVLPDLAKTSILEQLANLKRQKSMNEKIANLLNLRRASPTAIFFSVFCFVLIVSAAATFLLPKPYASDAQIMLGNKENQKEQVVSDPHAIQTEMETICSDPVLGAVVKKLNLDQEWSKKYAKGKFLDTAETIKLLRHHIVLHLSATSLVRIRVYDEKPWEATGIARAIVESYLELTDRNSHTEQSAKEQSVKILFVQAPTPPFIDLTNRKYFFWGGMLGGIGLGLTSVAIIKISRSISLWFSSRKVHA